jgi:4-aminobutyrate aminotransferase-like enzyme/Ser/Thr protein kinase RdoA (MazF antagonist)
MSVEILQEPPPAVDPEQAAAIVRELYGVSGEATPLAGERDRNFLIETQSGRLVLKIAHPAESLENLHMQQAALRHVHSWDPSIPVPEPVATQSGDLVGPAIVDDARLGVRLTSYLSGVTVEECGWTGCLRRNALHKLAALGLALRGFHHPALRRSLLWDLSRVGELRPYTGHLRSSRKAAAVAWLDHFDHELQRRLGALRRQPIHGDFNPANLVVAPGRPDQLCGVLDFGDMTVGSLATDVAIAAAYQTLGHEDPSSIMAGAVAAYHSAVPLTAEEVGLVPDLAVTRLVQSLIISAWRADLHPDNREYILIHAEPIWDSLQRMMELNRPGLAVDLQEMCRSGNIDRDDTTALEERSRVIAPGMRLTYDRPLHAVSAQGVWISDAAGVPHLDAYNNVAHVGHGRPEVVAALARQASRLNTNTRYVIDEVNAYAARLAAILPGPLDTVFFANSGAEANDLAWRLARTVTGRRGMVVTRHAYHGSTYLTMATSPEEVGITNLEPWVATIPPPQPGIAIATDLDEAVDGLQAAGEAPAAFACDTVFSSDGIYEVPAEYLAAVYRRMREDGGLCIADEVQAGLGRVGSRMWGFAGNGVTPDIVTLGKPLGNGHPLAAVVTTSALAEAFAAAGGYYFSTFAGNPVSAAVGMAVLDVMERDRLPQQADRVGAYLRSQLEKLAESTDCIAEVRGPGMFIGVEIVRSDGTADPGRAHSIQNAMRERCVLIGRTGVDGNVLKIRPPLVFEETHADLLVTTLSEVIG